MSIRTRENKEPTQMEKYHETNKYIERLQKCYEAFRKMNNTRKDLEKLRKEEDEIFGIANVSKQYGTR